MRAPLRFLVPALVLLGAAQGVPSDARAAEVPQLLDRKARRELAGRILGDTELKPMVSRVIRNNGFFEWWTRDNQPKGSGQFRGSAGVLGLAINQLLDWARNEAQEPAVVVPNDGSWHTPPPLPEGK